MIGLRTVNDSVMMNWMPTITQSVRDQSVPIVITSLSVGGILERGIEHMGTAARYGTI